MNNFTFLFVVNNTIMPLLNNYGLQVLNIFCLFFYFQNGFLLQDRCNLDVHLCNFKVVSYDHPFQLLKKWLVLLIVFRNDVEQGDLVIWVHKWQISQSELMYNVISTSETLKLYIQKIFSLNWKPNFQTHNPLQAPSLILWFHIL